MPDPEPQPGPMPRGLTRICSHCGSISSGDASACEKCGQRFEVPPPKPSPLGPPLTRQQVRELPGLRFDSIGGAMLLVAASAAVFACIATWSTVGFLLGLTLAVLTVWFVVLVQSSRRRGSPVDAGRAFKLLISSAALAFVSFGTGCIGFFGTCTATLMTTQSNGEQGFVLGLMVGVVGFVIVVGLSFPLFIRLFKINVRPRRSVRPESAETTPATEPNQVGKSPP